MYKCLRVIVYPARAMYVRCTKKLIRCFKPNTDYIIMQHVIYYVNYFDYYLMIFKNKNKKL